MFAYRRILGMTCLAASLVVGCAPQKSEPAPRPKIQRTTYTERVRQNVPPSTIPAPATQYNKSSRSIANRLEQIAVRMPHVRRATAIALGRYSIVGLDLDPKLDRGRVGTVKYSVAEALHKDPIGARALVTADTDLVQRLKNVNTDIKQGRPITGIMKELAAIAERIAPQPTRVTPKRTTSR